jgi:hypothetical protein
MSALESISRALTRVGDLLRYLTGGGSWRLRSSERIVLEAAISALEPTLQSQVRTQLQHKYFVERTSVGKRIVVLRFYAANPELRIADPDFDDLLLKVRISVDGAKQSSHVTFYKGYIFSIEFKKPQAFYEGKQLHVLDVIRGRPNDSFTRAIDRREHGRIE